jgi:hypothetical protein
MLSMLVEVFRGDRIAADRSLARQRDIPLENPAGIAAGSAARATAVKRLIVLRRSLLWRKGSIAAIRPTRSPV